MLDLHNKYRCAVGTPPLKWNGALQCQAQRTQNNIRAFSHSKSYRMSISAGENLATGSDVATAAWMWFTEYTQSSGTGHYTAMVWKDTTEVGCGMGQNVIRCQYAKSAPNMQGAYGANVPKFKGEKSKFSKCGISISEVRKRVKKFKSWGILKPEYALSASLGLYEEGAVSPGRATASLFLPAAAGALSAAAMVAAAVVARRRWWRSTATPASLLVEADGVDEGAANSLE